jgi:hypothetical protein
MIPTSKIGMTHLKGYVWFKAYCDTFKKSCHRGTHSYKNHVSQTTFIPKISWPTTMKILFSFIHTQFLIKVILAMIINKSQGQYVKYVGPNLRTPILSHGQLYVVFYWTILYNVFSFSFTV